MGVYCLLISVPLCLYRFAAEHPGVVFAKTSAVAEEVEIRLAKDPQQLFQPDVVPEVLHPKGLSAARRKYLHSVVRKYVHPDQQDELCPA